MTTVAAPMAGSAAPLGPGTDTLALSTHALNKSFGSLVVARDISISLPQGARYALIGPTGLVREVLHITRLDEAMPVYASLDDAIAGSDGVPGAGG